MNRETKRLREVVICDADYISIYITDIMQRTDWDLINVTKEVMRDAGHEEGDFKYVTLGEIADYIKTNATYTFNRNGNVLNHTPLTFVRTDMGLSGKIYRLFNDGDSIEEYATTRGYA